MTGKQFIGKAKTLSRRTLFRIIPSTNLFDKWIAWVRYVLTFRRVPNFSHPTRLTEFIALQRFAAPDPLLSAFTSDKALAKHYIASKLLQMGLDPAPLLAQTLYVTKDLNDPYFDSVIGPCVVKTTHASGGVVVIREPRKLTEEDRAVLRKSLSKNYYIEHRERNYLLLTPKIMVEEFIPGQDGDIPSDYKLFVFRGHPVLFHLDYDRFTNHKRQIYDPEFNQLPVKYLKDPGTRKFDRPVHFDLMKRIASEIGKDFELVRVDFFAQGDRLIVGELTHIADAGGVIFEPASFDEEVMRPYLSKPALK
ncbi:hypothetical protein EON79_01235 [bacterium]|nr:MAG: hypothetical protein EON79_01235 [bacterium]